MIIWNGCVKWLLPFLIHSDDLSCSYLEYLMSNIEDHNGCGPQLVSPNFWIFSHTKVHLMNDVAAAKMLDRALEDDNVGSGKVYSLSSKTELNKMNEDW